MPPTHLAAGYWGRPTSTLDWCEENYNVTPFVAEFWNTTSNWIMIIPPLVAAFYAVKDGFEFRITAGFIMLSMVGIGSFMFHCTLLYEMQLLDELPMIYGSCIMLYCLMSIKSKENQANRRLLVGLSAVALLITIMYVTVPNPLVFQWCYGILAGSIFVQTLWRFKQFRSEPRMMMVAMLGYAFGFVLWNIDNNLCQDVRYSRSLLPEWTRPVTQLHAWWHFFAGGSSYVSIIYQAHLRLKCIARKYSIQWCCRFMPLLRTVSPTASANGSAKSDQNFKSINDNNNIYHHDFAKTAFFSNYRKN